MFLFASKLKRLKSALRTWNKDVFGDVFENVKQAELRLRDFEKQYESSSPSYPRSLPVVFLFFSFSLSQDQKTTLYQR